MIDGFVFVVVIVYDFVWQLKLLVVMMDCVEGGKVLLLKILQMVNVVLGWVGVESVLFVGIGGVLQVYLLGQIYFSVMFFCYGDYVVKFWLWLFLVDLIELIGKKIDISDGDSLIWVYVCVLMVGFDVEWVFEVQLVCDFVC